MIAKHTNEQSEQGDGVEIVKNEDCNDPVHGKGRYTEKRVHLSKWVSYNDNKDVRLYKTDSSKF